MSKTRRAVVAGVMMLLCTPIALAKPNFSGQWKMNPTLSDFGEMTAPTSLVQQITHNEPDLRVVTTQVGEMGEFKVESAYTTDGKECVNKFNNLERKSTLTWAGDTLVVESKVDMGGHLIVISERWNLSEDAKTLTIHRHLKGPEGETDVRTVLEKQ